MLRRPHPRIVAIARLDRAAARVMAMLMARARLRLVSALLAVAAVIGGPLHVHAANPITQSIANDMIAAFTAWVAAGATWILGQVVTLVQQGTAVNLSGAWFTQHYTTMIALGTLVMAPMLLAAAAKAALSGNAAIAIRAAFVFVPLAFFGTFAAIQIVNMLLVIVDWASATMSQTLNADYQAFAGNISTALNGGNGNSVAAPFVIFLCAILMVVFGLLVFVELLFRNAAIYATAVFIPLAMATIVFPSTGRIAKRLIETLFGLILLKFFIVAVMSVGVSALGAQGNGGGFGTVLAGIVVLILAAVLPNLLIGLLPLAEGAAIATIASRTTSQQILQPSSSQIYQGIRRQNEQRIGSGGSTGGLGGASVIGGAVAGGATGVALMGAAQVGHGHAPSAAVAGGSLGGLSSPGPGGVGPISGGGGLSGVSVPGASSSGGVAAGSSGLIAGAITGFSARRVGGGTAAATATPPAAPDNG